MTQRPNRPPNKLSKSSYSGNRDKNKRLHSKKFKNKVRSLRSYIDPNLLHNYNLPKIESFGSIPKPSRKGLSKILKNLKFLTRFPEFISQLYGIPRELTSKACDEVVSDMYKRTANKGFVPTMVFFKTIHGAYIRFMSNSSFEPIPHNNIDTFGLPKEYPHLTQMAIVQGPEAHLYRKAVSTILQIFRMFEPKGDKPTLSSIVDPFPYPFNGDGQLGSFIESVISLIDDEGFDKQFLIECFRETVKEMFPSKSANRRLDIIKGRSKLHISTKNGPNGPCLPTAPIDLHEVDKRGMLDGFTDWAKFTNNTELLKVIEYYKESEPIISNLSLRQPQISKVSEKIEVGGKVRLFALLDYVTQSSFKGLHDYLFKILRAIPEDSTFDHSVAARKARAYTVSRDNLHIHSVDLSTATDRLPVPLQAEIVGQIVSDTDKGKLWQSLMTDRDFFYSGQNVRYAIGQPMGALSSWAMLAITHHIIVRLCFKYNRTKYRGKYLIIGDDVVIIGDKESQTYNYIMSKVLCVPISKVKGYSQDLISNKNPLNSDDTVTSTVEIAKRVFYNGVEITGVSPNYFIDFVENPGSVPNCVKSFVDKLSTEKKVFYLDWPVVKALSGLSFRQKLTTQIITLFLPDAISPREESVSKEEAEHYGIPWMIDELTYQKSVEYLSVFVVKSLCRLIDKSHDAIFEFTSGDFESFKCKGFTVEWTHNCDLLKMVSNHLVDNNLRTLSSLKDKPPSWDNLQSLSLLITEFYSVHDLTRILQGSEVDRRPERIKVAQETRKLLQSALKEAKLAELFSGLDESMYDIINPTDELKEMLGNLALIKWDPEEPDFYFLYHV
jgi:hypothetical protein